MGAESGSTKVDATLVNRAVGALMKHEASKASDALLGDDVNIHVHFTLDRIPEIKTLSPTPIRIEIPNPLHKVDSKDGGDEDDGLEDIDVCIIVKDESKEFVKEMIDMFPEHMSHVKKVLTLTSLRKKYTQYKNKRDLLKQYGLFMADDRILPMLGKLLGKNFFNAKKQPIPLKLTRKEAIPFAIQRCLRATFMHLNAGTCIAVRAGNTGMPNKKIYENILAIIKNGAERIPRKWSNISAISIKAAQSVSLPVYNKTKEELEEIERLSKDGEADLDDKAMKEQKKKRGREEEDGDEMKEKKSKSPLLKALKKQKMSKKETKATSSASTTKEIKTDPVSSEQTRKSAKEKKKTSVVPEGKEQIPSKSASESISKKKKKKDRAVSDEATKEGAKAEKKSFVASKRFKGLKKGYVFKKGDKGLGYYFDKVPVPDKAALAALARISSNAKSGGGGKRRKSRGRR